MPCPIHSDFMEELLSRLAGWKLSSSLTLTMDIPPGQVYHIDLEGHILLDSSVATLSKLDLCLRDYCDSLLAFRSFVSKDSRQCTGTSDECVNTDKDNFILTSSGKEVLGSFRSLTDLLFAFVGLLSFRILSADYRGGGDEVDEADKWDKSADNIAKFRASCHRMQVLLSSSLSNAIKCIGHVTEILEVLSRESSFQFCPSRFDLVEARATLWLIFGLFRKLKFYPHNITAMSKAESYSLMRQSKRFDPDQSIAWNFLNNSPSMDSRITDSSRSKVGDVFSSSSSSSSIGGDSRSSSEIIIQGLPYHRKSKLFTSIDDSSSSGIYRSTDRKDSCIIVVDVLETFMKHSYHLLVSADYIDSSTLAANRLDNSEILFDSLTRLYRFASSKNSSSPSLKIDNKKDIATPVKVDTSTSSSSSSSLSSFSDREDELTEIAVCMAKLVFRHERTAPLGHEAKSFLATQAFLCAIASSIFHPAWIAAASGTNKFNSSSSSSSSCSSSNSSFSKKVDFDALCSLSSDVLNSAHAKAPISLQSAGFALLFEWFDTALQSNVANYRFLAYHGMAIALDQCSHSPVLVAMSSQFLPSLQLRAQSLDHLEFFLVHRIIRSLVLINHSSSNKYKLEHIFIEALYSGIIRTNSIERVSMFEALNSLMPVISRDVVLSHLPGLVAATLSGFNNWDAEVQCSAATSLLVLLKILTSEEAAAEVPRLACEVLRVAIFYSVTGETVAGDFLEGTSQKLFADQHINDLRHLFRHIIASLRQIDAAVWSALYAHSSAILGDKASKLDNFMAEQ